MGIWEDDFPGPRHSHRDYHISRPVHPDLVQGAQTLQTTRERIKYWLRVSWTILTGNFPCSVPGCGRPDRFPQSECRMHSQKREGGNT